MKTLAKTHLLLCSLLPPGTTAQAGEITVEITKRYLNIPVSHTQEHRPDNNDEGFHFRGNRIEIKEPEVFAVNSIRE